MTKPSIFNIFEQPNGILDLEKGFDKSLKNIPAASQALLRISWQYMKTALVI